MTTLLSQRVLFNGQPDMMERKDIPTKIGRNFFATTMQDVLPETAAEVVKVIHKNRIWQNDTFQRFVHIGSTRYDCQEFGNQCSY